MISSNEKERENYGDYNYKIDAIISESENPLERINIEKIIDIVNSQSQGNIMLEGVQGINVNDFDTVECIVLMKQNEKLRTLAIPETTSDFSALISERLEEYLTSDNVLILDNCKFTVSDERLNMDETNEKMVVVFDYQNLSKQKQNYIAEKVEASIGMGRVGICLQSQNPLDSMYHELQNEFREIGMIVSVNEVDESGEQDYIYKMLNEYTKECAVVLAVFNCVTISNLWIKRRRKEFAIRRAFGYSMIQMTRLIVRYFLKLLGISIIFSSIMRCFICVVIGKVKFVQSLTIESAAKVLLMIIILFFVTIAKPLIEINKLDPAKSMGSR
jgi:hypothetical protein